MSETITIRQTERETLATIGRTTLMLDAGRFDSLRGYIYDIHAADRRPRPQEAQERPQEAQGLVLTKQLEKRLAAELADFCADDYTSTSRPPAAAWTAAGRRTWKDLDTARAILSERLEKGDCAAFALMSLFAVAYEWGRINGRKQGRKRHNKT